MGHFEKYNIINEEQHGFRKGRSCESQLALTINDLAKILDRQGQADVVITDFSKAFDTVPHKRLLLKLHRSGITGALHRWFKNFLTTRSQSVVLDGVSSSSVWVQSGVPQGTVMGPLLFILYISDLPQGIKSQVRLFADDCILLEYCASSRCGTHINKITKTGWKLYSAERPDLSAKIQEGPAVFLP